MTSANHNRRGLLEGLESEIVQGSSGSASRACRYLETAQENGWLSLVEEYRDRGRGDTLLHLAALFQQGERAAGLLRDLASLCPRLLGATRGGEYQGQTALHIVVSKGNLAGAAALLSSVEDLREKNVLLETRATGAKFVGTVMDGQLVLHVAALTLNQAMVDLLLDHGARLDAVNSLGDTALHALVRFAGRHPDKVDSVVQMLNHFHTRSCKKIRRPPRSRNINDVGNLIGLKALEGKGDQLSVWFLENNAGLTALKLAAYVGAGRICAHILSLDGVYRLLDTHDGLFDTHLYDITELDPVCNKLWQEQRQDTDNFGQGKVIKPARREVVPSLKSKVSPLDINDNNSWSGNRTEDEHQGCRCACVPSCCSMADSNTQSVLEIICGVGASQAFCLISTDVVRQIVKSKWHRLRGLYYTWMLAHLLFMVGLTFYAIYRPRINNEDQYSNASQTFNVSSDPLSYTQRTLVKAWPWVGTAQSVAYLVLECIRTIGLSQAWHLRRLYHNGLYRLLLVFFSLCLIVDSLWYWFHEHDADSNVFLILALLLGGWFSAFFLRAWRKFSFFTILFQKVLVGDMFRFSIMILLELIAFSAAMYVAYLPTSSPPGLPEEFDDIWTSILTMFRLMLGLSDIEILSQAPAPWVAIGLYVVFVLLTYVLLLNSLIAMMSQTCALVSEDRDLQWHMQRLSVLLMLETLLPLRCRPLMGQLKSCRRDSLKTGFSHQENRYLKPVTSVQANYTDGKAILRRQNLVRTMGFGELTLNLAPAHINTFSTSPLRQQTKGTMHMQDTLSSPKNFYANSNNTQNYTFSEEQEDVYLDQEELSHLNQETRVEKEPQAVTTSGKTSEPRESHLLAFSDENIAVIQATPGARRRHNSERRNRRTQTESNGPLSQSYPDGMLRNQHQHQVPTVSSNENFHQPVVHYLALPGGSVLPQPSHLPGVQIGYVGNTNTENLLPRQIINGYPHHVTSNDAQTQAHPAANNNLHPERYLPHAYSAMDLRILANPHISGVSPAVPLIGSNIPQTTPLPTYSDQGPVRARQTGTSPRIQFVDVNDLSTEA